MEAVEYTSSCAYHHVPSSFWAHLVFQESHSYFDFLIPDILLAFVWSSPLPFWRQRLVNFLAAECAAARCGPVRPGAPMTQMEMWKWSKPLKCIMYWKCLEISKEKRRPRKLTSWNYMMIKIQSPQSHNAPIDQVQPCNLPKGIPATPTLSQHGEEKELKTLPWAIRPNLGSRKTQRNQKYFPGN